MRDKEILGAARFVDWGKLYDQVFDAYYNSGSLVITVNIGLIQSIPFNIDIVKKDNFKDTLQNVIDKIRRYRNNVFYEANNGKYMAFISNRNRKTIQDLFLKLVTDQGAAQYALNNNLDYTIKN